MYRSTVSSEKIRFRLETGSAEKGSSRATFLPLTLDRSVEDSDGETVAGGGNENVLAGFVAANENKNGFTNEVFS
jgi:hypothetical protein